MARIVALDRDVWLSENGHTWAAGPDLGIGVPITCGAAGPGRFTVGGPGGTLFTSTNGGASWTPITLPGSSGAVTALAYGDGHWVAGTQYGAWRSSDGVTWTAASPTHYWGFSALVYTGTPGIFVGFADNEPYRTTNNGASWTRISGTGSYMAGEYLGKIARGDDGKLIYTCIGSSDRLKVSTNGGLSWTDLTRPGGVMGWNGIATNGAGTWVMASDVTFARSTDNGVTWTTYTVSASTGPRDAWTTWDKSGGQFLAASALNGLFSSPDGLTWTRRSTATSDARVILTAPNTPPLAPSWVTPQNTVIPTDADFDLDWDHNDPDPGDGQSEYVLDRWTLDANGARVAGSLLRVTVATPNTYRRITAGSLAVGAYEYKVATRDSQGVPTDPAQLVFSESLFVTAAESPDPPTFVAPGPIAGETISTSSREYVISAPDVDASEWTLYADNNGTIDTSTILAGPVLKETGDLRRHTFTGLANNTAVWASVEIKDGGLWSQPTQQRNPVSYTPPPAPTYTLLEDPAEGEIVVQINNPAPGAGEVATSYNDVFITDPGKPEQRRATEIPANGAWTYQLPPSGFDGVTTGVVRVEAVADNGVRTSST